MKRSVRFWLLMAAVILLLVSTAAVAGAETIRIVTPYLGSIKNKYENEPQNEDDRVDFEDEDEGRGRVRLKREDCIVMNEDNKGHDKLTVIVLSWNEERKKFVDHLKAIGVPVLVLVITDADNPLVLDPESMKDRPENFHTLEVDKIQGGLASL